MSGLSFLTRLIILEISAFIYEHSFCDMNGLQGIVHPPNLRAWRYNYEQNLFNKHNKVLGVLVFRAFQLLRNGERY